MDMLVFEMTDGALGYSICVVLAAVEGFGFLLFLSAPPEVPRQKSWRFSDAFFY